MWKTKTFKTRQAMKRFLAKHPNIQWNEIYVNNGYGIEYRALRIIDIE